MAFTNPEYMTSSELNEAILKYNRIDTTKSINKSNTNSMKRRAVPLPPPPQYIPAPPQSPPPLIHRTKLYQNVDHFNQYQHEQEHPIDSIHIDCDFFRTPQSNYNENNLLMQANNNSLYLVNNNSATSDSSSATMIVKKSPTNYSKSSISSGSLNYDLEDNDDLLCAQAALRVSDKNSKFIGSLSPIMTSSRADLNITSRVALNLNPDINEEDEYDEKFTTLIQKTPPTVFQSQLTNSLPCNRVKQNQFKRLSFSKENDLIEKTMINDKKSFNNYNYELIMDDQASTSLSSVDSLILLPPSPFKSSMLATPQNKSNIKATTTQCNKQSTKKVSFLIRETHHTRSIEQLYYDEDYEDEFIICAEDDKPLRRHRRNSLSSGSSSSCSTNSSINIVSNSILKSKIIFSNNHYFISADKQASSSASSSSSSIPACSSSSSCSSTSSASSGYKSNQSASINQLADKYMFKPSELDTFIKISRDRLERLKQKRTQIITENTFKLEDENDEDFVRMEMNTLNRKEHNQTAKSTTSSNYVDSLLFKNVSAKLFQKLLGSKQNSPCSTLPKRSK